MKKVSIIIWIVIFLFVGFFGWFMLEYMKDKQQVVDGLYGVFFQFVDQIGKLIIEVVFCDKLMVFFFGYMYCLDVCFIIFFEMDGWL